MREKLVRHAACAFHVCEAGAGGRLERGRKAMLRQADIQKGGTSQPMIDCSGHIVPIELSSTAPVLRALPKRETDRDVR